MAMTCGGLFWSSLEVEFSVVCELNHIFDYFQRKIVTSKKLESVKCCRNVHLRPPVYVVSTIEQ